MRIETIQRVLVTWDELTKDKQEKIAESWDNEGQDYEHNMQERIDTLKAIAKILGGKLDYVLSCVPDRGEFITIKHQYDHLELDFQALHDVIKEGKDCPFTGCCYDEDFIDNFKSWSEVYKDDKKALSRSLYAYKERIHNEYESMQTIEYIGELCRANDYEFDFETLERV